MLTRLTFIICWAICLFTLPALADGPQVYRGTWRSQSTGHQGPMRVKVSPRTDGNYDARFSGRFLLVIPFTYKVRLDNQGWGPSGQQLGANRQLGPFLGSYQMTATMGPSFLSGSFSAAGDTGQISMRRVR